MLGDDRRSSSYTASGFCPITRRSGYRARCYSHRIPGESRDPPRNGSGARLSPELRLRLRLPLGREDLGHQDLVDQMGAADVG
jgi:hypothetical protein